MATIGSLSGRLSLPVPVAAARAVAASGRGSVLKSTDKRVVGRGRRLGERAEEGKRKARLLIVVRLRRIRRRLFCNLLLGGDVSGVGIAVCI